MERRLEKQTEEMTRAAVLSTSSKHGQREPDSGQRSGRAGVRRFLGELIPDDWPTRTEFLWTIRVTVALLILLGILTLIGLPFNIALWDWLELLIVPVALAIGGFWLNRVQREREREVQEAQRKREIEIEDNRSQDAALEAYLDRMGELLERNVRASQKGDDVRVSARARTIETLSRLDANRKASVLRFLYEANLIDKSSGVVDLDGGDLRGADLYGFKLANADLSGANLSGANLTLADLTGAKLTYALFRRSNLTRARLRNAQMTATTLRRASLEHALLDAANLTNAVLPRANLSGASLNDTVLRHANLDRTIMRNVRARHASFRGARLFSSDLSEADLRDTDMHRTRFEVYLTDRVNGELDAEGMTRLDMDEEDLIQEDLEDAVLTGAILDRVDLSDTRISDQQLSSCASREKVVLPWRSKLTGR
jgi:uncharacterized protein YjbI with pentapeptide repeats